MITDTTVALQKIQYVFPKRANMNFYLKVLGVTAERLYITANDCCQGKHSKSLYERMTDDDILYYAKAGFKRMVKSYHPDNHSQDKDYYADMIGQIKEAYDGVHRLLYHRHHPLKSFNCIAKWKQ